MTDNNGRNFVSKPEVKYEPSVAGEKSRICNVIQYLCFALFMDRNPYIIENVSEALHKQRVCILEKGMIP